MPAILLILALGLALIGAPAYADSGSPYGDLTQMALSEDQIKHYIEAIPDMQAAMGDAPADAAEPDAKTMGRLQDVAKAHGFKDFDDYNTIAGNIALVLDGVDSDTKAYVGAQKMIAKSIAEVQADKAMTEKDRAAALADLDAQLKSLTPVKFPENIPLVVKYYAKLTGG